MHGPGGSPEGASDVSDRPHARLQSSLLHAALGPAPENRGEEARLLPRLRALVEDSLAVGLAVLPVLAAPALVVLRGLPVRAAVEPVELLARSHLHRGLCSQATLLGVVVPSGAPAERALLRVRVHVRAALSAAQGLALAHRPRPVKHAVNHEALPHEQVLEEPPKVGVVRPVLEAQATAVRQIRRERLREAFAELLDRRDLLQLTDLLVLLLLAVSHQPLPGELATVEIHEHVADGLEVVASALLHPEVGVDGGVAGGAGQALALAVLDVLLGLGIVVPLCQPEVNEVDDSGLLAQPDEKIVGLDVPVNEVL
mmetsp:Transcript_33103/g.98391  ORF Transcript_33103/g.98391 Transcript_33103/m.98391 type:complete len:313 (+) Transcript_33103:197-1135(+)